MHDRSGSRTLERDAADDTHAPAPPPDAAAPPPGVAAGAAAHRRAAPVTRRSVLAGVAGSIALAGCAELDGLVPGLTSPDEPTPPASGGAGGGGASAPPAPDGDAGGQAVEPVLADDAVLHLLRRATFGPTAALVEEVRDSGVDAWLDRQLAPDDIDDSACEQLLARYPTLGASAAEINQREEADGGRFQADRDLVQATVLRAVCSERQLFEVMVEFWANHFNIQTPSDDDWGRRTVADREVYRAHALGRFADLLLASAQDPAMLRYLNNELSCATGDPSTVQENYGRELLELHTLGVGNYTEDDVKNSAYILTGWRADDARQFRFDPGCHYTGAVQVLDFTHANETQEGGLEVGEAYLDHLAHHELTAQFVCRKLVRRFVADEPDDDLVATLAEVYLDNDTEIVPVLRALFTSDAFRSAIGRKTRRPLEDVVATARALDMRVLESPRSEFPRTLLDVAYELGQAPMNWAPPNGYPDVASVWLSSARLLGSWNYHWDLLEGRYDDWLSPAADAVMQLADGGGETVGDVVDGIAERLLWQQLRDEDRAAVIEFTGRAAGDPAGEGDALTDVVKRAALAILNSPYHLQR
ncbi:MAG TPA: DUF1800 domain-containing protein [Euzebyales bacterium]|nr:DUF1800 domain-containing protein [Euzebyales bacterium]